MIIEELKKEYQEAKELPSQLNFIEKLLEVNGKISGNVQKAKIKALNILEKEFIK